MLLFLMNGSSYGQAKIEGAYSSGIVNAPATSSVDHNTGILNYNIPLVSVSHNDVKVNIALSYAARGIKVEQMPTSVGLGWNLSGIGVISRTVRGSATDESWSRGKLDDTTSAETLLSPEHFDRINSRVRDGESDIFSLSYNHLSIRFILKRVNDSVIAVPLERTSVKIIVVEGMALTAFRVIDEEGNRYYFGDKESIGAYPGMKLFQRTTHLYMEAQLPGIFPISKCSMEKRYILNILQIIFRNQIQAPMRWLKISVARTENCVLIMPSKPK